jgi:hypothetical protein
MGPSLFARALSPEVLEAWPNLVVGNHSEYIYIAASPRITSEQIAAIKPLGRVPSHPS